MARSDIFDDIKNDVKQYSSDIAKYSAIEARDLLYRETVNAIDKFYADYTPGDYHDRKAEFAYENDIEFDGEANAVYQRTYNLYHSYKKYYKNNHDTVFSGGVILSPEFMRNTYRGSRELVFDLAYAGFHGLNSWEQGTTRPASPYAVTTPSPMEMIEKTQNDILNKPDSIIKVAVKKANEQAYNVF